MVRMAVRWLKAARSGKVDLRPFWASPHWLAYTSGSMNFWRAAVSAAAGLQDGTASKFFRPPSVRHVLRLRQPRAETAVHGKAPPAPHAHGGHGPEHGGATIEAIPWRRLSLGCQDFCSNCFKIPDAWPQPRPTRIVARIDDGSWRAPTCFRTRIGAMNRERRPPAGKLPAVPSAGRDAGGLRRCCV